MIDNFLSNYTNSMTTCVLYRWNIITFQVLFPIQCSMDKFMVKSFLNCIHIALKSRCIQCFVDMVVIYSYYNEESIILYMYHSVSVQRYILILDKKKKELEALSMHCFDSLNIILYIMVKYIKSKGFVSYLQWYNTLYGFVKSIFFFLSSVPVYTFLIVIFIHIIHNFFLVCEC